MPTRTGKTCPFPPSTAVSPTRVVFGAHAALEKEEQLKELKKKIKIVKNALQKERDANSEMKRELEFYKSQGVSKGAPPGSSDRRLDISAPKGGFKSMTGEEYSAIKEQCEKEAFQKTEKAFNEVKKRSDDQEQEIKLMTAQLKQAMEDSKASAKECQNLKSEATDLKNEVERLVKERDLLKGKIKDADAASKTTNEKLMKLEDDHEKSKRELEILKSKLVEGEYAAYCYSLKEKGTGGHMQGVQLVLRKNCFGEGVLEFENKNGDLRVVKASLLSDVESDQTDNSRIIFKFVPSGCFGMKTIEQYHCENRQRLIWNIKTFLKEHKEPSVHSPSPSMLYQRNIVNDLRKLFLA